MNVWIGLLVGMPMAAALISYGIGRKSKTGRDIFLGCAVAAEFLMAVMLLIRCPGEENVVWVLPEICGMGLKFQVNGFRAIYALIAAFMWMMTGLLSPEYFAHYRNRNRYYLFQLITLGATEGIFLAADLYTTCVFFEIM